MKCRQVRHRPCSKGPQDGATPPTGRQEWLARAVYSVHRESRVSRRESLPRAPERSGPMPGLALVKSLLRYGAWHQRDCVLRRRAFGGGCGRSVWPRLRSYCVTRSRPALMVDHFFSSRLDSPPPARLGWWAGPPPLCPSATPARPCCGGETRVVAPLHGESTLCSVLSGPAWSDGWATTSRAVCGQATLRTGCRPLPLRTSTYGVGEHKRYICLTMGRANSGLVPGDCVCGWHCHGTRCERVARSRRPEPWPRPVVACSPAWVCVEAYFAPRCRATAAKAALDAFPNRRSQWQRHSPPGRVRGGRRLLVGFIRQAAQSRQANEGRQRAAGSTQRWGRLK